MDIYEGHIRRVVDERFVRRFILGCAFVAAYVALDYVSFVKPYRGLGITPWNPPPGLSIALMYLGGWVYAPFVVAAPVVADAVVRGTPLGSSPEIIASALNGGVYVLTGIGLSRLSTFDPRFHAVRDATTFIAVAIVAAASGTAVYLGTLAAGGVISSAELRAVAWRASVGETIGILVVAPLVLLARTHRPWPAPSLQVAAQLCALLGALAIVFGYREATAFQLFYLLFLPLLWVALVHGPAGAAAALAVIQVGLIIGADIRFGPDPGLGALQVLMVALTITGLVVGALVAEREDASARLRDQQAALSRALRIRSAGEVAASIAHEINQPLTALTTYSGIASEAMETGKMDLAHRAINKIAAECGRAKAVLEGIRELLRKGTVTPHPVEIRLLLGELEEIFADDFAKKGLRLNVRVSEQLSTIAVDGVQIQQAVHNLILNSAEAIAGMDRAGKIEVSATLANGDYIIEVADDGPGFPPGFNVSEPTPLVTTKPEGSGLGLAVARSIVEAHGGSMSISSSIRGASVRLQLPSRRYSDEAHGLTD
jgi:two-component system, LuxR family, sensor kinase FixL